MKDTIGPLYNESSSSGELPDDVDELIDGLPQHLQNKVLQQFGAPGGVTYERPSYNRRQNTIWWLLMIPASVWALLWVVLAVLTIWLVPVAIMCIWIAACPVGWLVSNRLTPQQTVSKS